MSFPHPRGRGRRLTLGSERAILPMLNSYPGGTGGGGEGGEGGGGGGGGASAAPSSAMSGVPVAAVGGECVPVYFHVEALPQPHQFQHRQHHNQRQKQPSYHSQRSVSHHHQHRHPPPHPPHYHQSQSYHFSSPPHRFFSNSLPSTIHQQQQQISPTRHIQTNPAQIIDAYTLSRAVRNDADATFHQLQQVYQERSELKIRVTTLSTECESVRRDYVALMKGYEKMQQIWLEKQFLMWRFVERIRLERNGEGSVKKGDGDVAAGEWVGVDAEEGMTKEDVEILWSRQFRRNDKREGDGGEDADEGERGRSRLVKDLRSSMSDFTSTVEVETSTGIDISRTNSVNNDNLEVFDGRLDPSAKPFEPSPTRKTHDNNEAVLPDSTSVKTPALPSFRDVLTGSPVVKLPPPSLPARSKSVGLIRKSPERPWIEVRNRRSEQHDHLRAERINEKRPISKARSTVSSQGASGNGGKNSKSKRGGQQPTSNAPVQHGAEKVDRENVSSTLKEQETLKLTQREKYKHVVSSHQYSGHGHPSSPRKLNDPWRVSSKITAATLPISLPSSTFSATTPGLYKHVRPRPSKKHTSPEIERIANLPLFPLSKPNPFSEQKSRHSQSPEVSPTSTTRKKCDGDMGPPRLSRSDMPSTTVAQQIKHKTRNFMSRARLQATLQSVAAPYDKICPNTLVNIQCDVVGCELVKLCPHYNNTSTKQDGDDEDFPALGSETSRSGNGTADFAKCTKLDGTAVKEGEICSTGYIHLKPSCPEEADNNPCYFWTTPPRNSSTSTFAGSTSTTVLSATSKKFKSLNLDYDYTAPASDFQRPLSSLPHSTSTSTSQDPFTETASSTHSHQHRKVSNERSHKVNSRSGVTYSHNHTEKQIEHFNTYVHERDGIGRDAWHARCLNAELREVHECGLWGVGGDMANGGEIDEDNACGEEHGDEDLAIENVTAATDCSGPAGGSGNVSA